jgi:phosphoribosylaminoimidazole-succinocarboxamide synthase
MKGEAPQLPLDIIEGTSARYQDAFKIIVGTTFEPMKETNVTA